MKMKCLPFLLLATTASFSLACSSGEDNPGSDEGPGPGTGCDPMSDIPCIEGFAEPCGEINSGFPGDEYCIKPPDAERGIQLHVGPKDYTDPDDYGRFIIEPGDETDWAEVTRLPNTETVYVNGYYSYMRPGSHHFILYALPEDTELPEGGQQTGSGAESAVGALDGEFSAGATRQIQNAVLDSEYPEDQGNGSEMTARRPVAVNLHFINTSPDPLLQEIWVNYRTIPREDVKRWVKPITWYGGLGMNIAPGEHVVLKSDDSACAPPGDIRINGMTGHVHANTLRYNATMQRAGESERVILFEDNDWHEPAEWRYSRAITNPAPDIDAGKAGGYSGLVESGPGDQFFWECEVKNETDVNLTFSNRVYDGEMCNVFGFYSTDNKDLGPWMCFF